MHKYLRDYKKNTTFAAEIEKYALTAKSNNHQNTIIMKVQHFILAFAAAAMLLTACNEKQVMPGDNDHNQPALTVPDPTPDPEGFVAPEGAINVYDAVDVAKALKFGDVSEKRYLIKGYLTSFNRGETFKDDFPVYGNDFFYISAVAPTEELQPIHNFYAYRALGKYGAKFPDLDCLKEGDFVVLSCFITNYNGVFESSGACFVVASNNEHFNEIYKDTYNAPTLKKGETSVSEAELTTNKLANKSKTTEYFDVRGYISSIDTVGGRTLASVTFNFTDGMTFATAFKTFYKAADQPFESLDQVAVGDNVVVHAQLQNFNGTCEPSYGYIVESSNPHFK